MKLARTIRFDESDTHVFERAAEAGEWALSGAFEFSNWDQADLSGKRKQAFANGWLSLDSFGRCTFVATAEITQAELEALTMRLAAHFVEGYGAPDLDAAWPVAEEEIRHMRELCDEHKPNTLLVVERGLEEAGVRESFRVIETAEATIMDVLGPMADHAVEMSRVDPKPE